MKHVLFFFTFISVTLSGFCQEGNKEKLPIDSTENIRSIEDLSRLFNQLSTTFSESQGSQVQLNIDVEVLDSILNTIPLPNSIEWNSETFRLDDMKMLATRYLQHQPKTERQEIVQFGSDVIIGRNEWINGDVILFGGDAMVYGTVKGGIVVIKGNVRLASTSYVEDDVFCIWGDAEVDKGARIAGKTNVMNFSKIFEDTDSGLVPVTVGLLRFLRIIFLFLIALLINKAFPKHTSRIENCIKNDYPKTLIVGFVGIVLLPVIFIVLLATILGIPVAVLFLPLLVIGGFLHGITGFALWMGKFIRSKFNFKITSPAATLGVGILVLEMPSILNKITSLISSMLGIVFLLATIFVFFAAWVPGLGAVILTRFGTR